jgi:CheY-like chemotaxis protein
VALRIGPPAADARYHASALRAAAGRNPDEGGGVIAFEVADTGIGIAADKLLLIFEAFQQADGSTNRRFGGTGLGLTISRDIAALLGGEIQVRSVEGEGSTFTLYLPCEPAPVAGEPGEGGDRLPPMVGRRRPRREPAREDRTAGNQLEALPAATPIVATADQPPIAVIASEPGVDDDRDDLRDDDRVLLIISGDDEFAATAVGMGRERDFKVLVAQRGDSGLALAREHRPDAIVLDTQLPQVDGLAVLEALKRQSSTRHIPVHIVSPGEQRQSALTAGALAYLEKPVNADALATALLEIGHFIDRRVRHLLVVEDDDRERRSIIELIGADDDVSITGVATSEEALEALSRQRFDCIVLDLKLPRMTGFDLLERVKEDPTYGHVPVVVYTGRDLTRREETRLKKYAEAIIVKDAGSPERLFDETALFLHRVESRMPAEKRRMIQQLHTADAVFQGRHVLVVDDDVRNVFALTSALEERGMRVSFAENGREGIEALNANPDVDLVLMDIMMPELDGYETTRIIRTQEEHAKLPIIALTAKAMKGDRERCIAAGASDYITKPVDVEQLLSLMRVWLYR